MFLVLLTFLNCTNSTFLWAEDVRSKGLRLEAPSNSMGMSSEWVHWGADISLEYRHDQLRETQNNNMTTLRNLSFGFLLNSKKSTSLYVEILGDENKTGEVNIGAGELYVRQKIPVFWGESLVSQLRLGIIKMDFGVLNRIDGLFAVLPGYYSFLYDLPRGLDTGASLEVPINNEFYVMGSGFAGQNMRETDHRSREINVVPHHFQAGWKRDRYSASLNYYGRKYKGQPLVQGIGLQAQRQMDLYSHWWDVSWDSELWFLTSSLNGEKLEGTSLLLGPRVAYKGFFGQVFLAGERWVQPGTPHLDEMYVTSKAGYVWNPQLQIVFEQTRIQNRQTKMARENSFQLRFISSWVF